MTIEISEYEKDMPQSHTADQPTAPLEREAISASRHQEDN